MKFRLPPIAPSWLKVEAIEDRFDTPVPRHFFRVIDSSDAIVACVSAWGDVPHESKANAAAIAAVPALLRALIECHDVLRARHLSTGINAHEYAALITTREALKGAGCVPVSSESRSFSSGGNHVPDPVQ